MPAHGGHSGTPPSPNLAQPLAAAWRPHSAVVNAVSIGIAITFSLSFPSSSLVLARGRHLAPPY